MRWISGRWRRLRDGWRVKLVDEDTRWYLGRVEPSFDRTSATTLLSGRRDGTRDRRACSRACRLIGSRRPCSPDMTMPAPTASPTIFPISTGPITRSRATKIQQEVHALLYEFQFNTNDNFMLPKSCMLILLRYVEENHQDEGHEARIGKVLIIRQGHSAISSKQLVIRQAIRQSPEPEVRPLNCTNLQSFT
jgi:hypothetical protein